MIKGEIYYGDLNLTLVKEKKQRGTGKIIGLDRHNFKVNRLVFTVHAGKVVNTANVEDRVKRKLPPHLQSYDVTMMTFVDGVRVGETSYDITTFI